MYELRQEDRSINYFNTDGKPLGNADLIGTCTHDHYNPGTRPTILAAFLDSIEDSWGLPFGSDAR